MTENGEDPVDVLGRWERSGGRWRILARSGASVTVGLFSCDDEEMGRLTSEGAELDAYLAGRAHSDD